jgi:hypothetical protein
MLLSHQMRPDTLVSFPVADLEWNPRQYGSPEPEILVLFRSRLYTLTEENVH